MLCQVCQTIYKPYERSPDGELVKHDCLKALQEKIQVNEKSNDLLKLSLGTNYSDMNLKCYKQEQLSAHTGKYIQKYRNQVYKCKLCSRRDLHFYDLYYTCKFKEHYLCQEDKVCRLCALQTGADPILKPKGTLFPSIHKCPLLPNPPEKSNWICSIYKVNKILP